MSEVPIKHFWTTPTVELDFTSLTNRLTELRAQIYTLTRERDAAVQDAAHQLDLRYAANRELVALQRETDALKAELAKVPTLGGALLIPCKALGGAAMKSGDRVDTGTGDARRPLTLSEAEAGELPERMTADEWAAMHRASTGTKAERGAAVNHAKKVVLAAAVAYVDSIYMIGEHPGPYLRRLQTTQGALRAAVKALKAAEAAS